MRSRTWNALDVIKEWIADIPGHLARPKRNNVLHFLSKGECTSDPRVSFDRFQGVSMLCLAAIEAV